LPAQRISDGVVKIDVVVGQYDKIVLDNKTVIKESMLKKELGLIRSGVYIEKAALERAVWLLSDLAGAEAKVTLSAGSKSGTSNLLITLEPQQGNLGSISLDNYGNRYTGRLQTGVSYKVENLARQGDVMSLQITTTPGNELTTGSAFYTLPAFGQGQKLGIGYSRVSYTLGDEFSPYDAEGTADVLKLSWNYAIKRSQLNNLYGEIRLEKGDLKDRFAGIVIGDKTTKAAVLSLNGDCLDQQGATSYLLSYKIGELTINNEVADAAQTGGTYGKYSLSVLRQQYINPRAYLLLLLMDSYQAKTLTHQKNYRWAGLMAYGHILRVRPPATKDIWLARNCDGCCR
jgi:hemolysin activation/secretion protein